MRLRAPPRRRQNRIRDLGAMAALIIESAGYVTLSAPVLRPSRPRKNPRLWTAIVFPR